MALSRTEHSWRRLAAERRKFMLTTGGAAVGLGLLAERSQAFGQGQGDIAQLIRQADLQPLQQQCVCRCTVRPPETRGFSTMLQ